MTNADAHTIEKPSTSADGGSGEDADSLLPVIVPSFLRDFDRQAAALQRTRETLAEHTTPVPHLSGDDGLRQDGEESVHSHSREEGEVMAETNSSIINAPVNRKQKKNEPS